MATKINNMTALLITTILLLLALVAYWISDLPTKANTNFVCQMQGKWSNEHHNVSEVRYLGNGDWRLSYPDNEIQVIYHQRQGEDCGTKTYTKDQSWPTS